MKKLIVLILALGTITSAFAQAGPRTEANGSIKLGDGRNVVRISVGDDRDERDMLRRIHRLEQAVRDLQDQVYQLQSAPQQVSVKVHVCTGKMFRAGQVTGKGSSRVEAIGNAMDDCSAKRGDIFCEEDKLRCDTYQERR